MKISGVEFRRDELGVECIVKDKTIARLMKSDDGKRWDIYVIGYADAQASVKKLGLAREMVVDLYTRRPEIFGESKHSRASLWDSVETIAILGTRKTLANSKKKDT